MSYEIKVGDNLEAKRARFEAERMSRRQALKRFGFRAAGATFAAFTVDDIARAVIARMEKEEVMRGVTESIAEEFKNAGVAFAEPEPLSPCSGCSSSCEPDDENDCVECGDTCQGGKKKKPNPCKKCVKD